MSKIWNNTLSLATDFLTSIIFLFFIQLITLLIETVYATSIVQYNPSLHTFGLLLLFTPLLFSFFNLKKKYLRLLVPIFLACVALCIVLPAPYLIYSSALGAGLILYYIFIRVSEPDSHKINIALAVALSILVSVLFRLMGHSLDFSLVGNGKIITWGLIIVGIFLFSFVSKNKIEVSELAQQNIKPPSFGGSFLSLMGITSNLLFLYAVFSSPGVIARWTGGDYVLIHIVFVISILAFTILKSRVNIKYSKLSLLVWNILFLAVFLSNIFIHQVQFPISPDSDSVVSTDANFIQALVTYLMLFLSPVIFMNIESFGTNVRFKKSSQLSFPFLFAVLLIIIFVFTLIYTNTWGYAQPLSSGLRNQFHIPFALLGLFLIVPYFFRKYFIRAYSRVSILYALIALIFLVPISIFLHLNIIKHEGQSTQEVKELKIMTYNIQQGIDWKGRKNFQAQVELLKKIDPDVICLQESDGSRISGGNSDVVRYFSEKLKFHSYYGPKTVTGTFGTAILSRYPLEDCKTIFTYSTEDEIGTAVVKLKLNEKNITIVNSQPAGNADARKSHINQLLKIAQPNDFVVALGDYNFTQSSTYYLELTQKLNDAWLSLYPNAVGYVDKTDSNYHLFQSVLIDSNGVDMTNRIDHIFTSKSIKVNEAYFLPVPYSKSDHPAHWVVISLD